MSISIISKGSDFGLSGIGRTIPTTTTDQLKSFHFTFDTIAFAQENPTGNGGALVKGFPVVTSNCMEVDNDDGLILSQTYGLLPDSTFCCVVKVVDNTLQNGDNTFFGTLVSTAGSAYMFFQNTDNTIEVQATVHDKATHAFEYVVAANMPRQEVGTYQMYFGVMDSSVGVSLYHPASRTLVTDTFNPATESFIGTSSRTIQIASAGSNPLDTLSVSLGAVWEKALAQSDMDIFYNEMKAALLSVGITI